MTQREKKSLVVNETVLLFAFLTENILVCNNDAVYRLQGNSYLYLQVFEDVHSTSATQIGWGTRQGVLLQVEITKSYHEPDQSIIHLNLSFTGC